MAVPKRRMSRSNTRFPPLPVADFGAHAGALPAVPQPQTAARSLPDVWYLQAPTGHHPTLIH